MNYKKYLKDFEQIMDEEIETNNPLININKNTVIYKKFKIKQNNVGHWDLFRSSGDLVHTFKLKSSAIAAAKFYSECKYHKAEELKSLDGEYWNSYVDVSFFRQRLQESSEPLTKDIFLSKLSNATDKANKLKHTIINRLNVEI
jgi:hypothetical protein